jgi:hypothetical protein
MTLCKVNPDHLQRLIVMKNLPAFITLATLAALGLLAVISSVTASVPFLPIAAYIVSGASSLGLLGVFLGDYTRGAPRRDRSRANVRQPRVQPSGREAREVAPRAIWPALGMRNDPVTLTFS